MTDIVLATKSQGFERRLRKAMAASNGQIERWGGSLTASSKLEQVVVDLTAENPVVVAIGPGVDSELAMQLAGIIDRDRPEVTVLVVTEPGPDIWEQAVRVGVRDVIPPEADGADLSQVFDKAVMTARRRRDNLIEEVAPATAQGRIITVLAPKGGSGKTALAVNTAVALAARHPGEVALIDLDLLFGDVTNALLLNPEHSIADAMKTGHVDDTTLKVLLTSRGSGLFVMAAPDQPGEGEMVTESLVAQTLDTLRRQFAYVVVDTAAGLGEVTLAAIERTDDLMFICDMSVSAVRGLRKVRDALERLEMMPPRRHFILNRSDSKVGITLEDVESTVGMRVDVKIPSSRLVPRSMNEGTPVIETAPRTPVAQAYQLAVDLLVPEPSEKPKARRRWRSA